MSKAGEVKILSCGIRVGGKDADVDNYHAGGVGYPIHPDFGIISGPGHNLRGEAFYNHPSTGVSVLGYQIPLWNKVLEAVAELTKIEPRGRMIGWDLAITNEGVELVEANYLPDPGFMQRLTERGLKPEILDYL